MINKLGIAYSVKINTKKISLYLHQCKFCDQIFDSTMPVMEVYQHITTHDEIE